MKYPHTARDVVQRARIGVQPRVEEPQRALARRHELIVDERNRAREDRCGTRGPVNELGRARVENLDVLSLSGDIGEPTARGGVEARVLGADAAHVRRNDVGLVGGDGEDRGEASA